MTAPADTARAPSSPGGTVLQDAVHHVVHQVKVGLDGEVLQQ